MLNLALLQRGSDLNMTSSMVSRLRTRLGISEESFALIFGLEDKLQVRRFESGQESPPRIVTTVLTLLESLPDEKAYELLKQMEEAAEKNFR